MTIENGNKIIVRTRKVGKSQLFRLNTENPIVQNLMALDKKLMLLSLESAKVVKKTV